MTPLTTPHMRLIVILLYFFMTPLSPAQTNLIERIQETEASIVTIEAQQLTLDKHQKPIAGLSPDGQLVIGTQNRASIREKTGAGVIIDPSGYVVTNTHTILYAQFIFVTLQNNMRLPATIASIAPDSDFTILKISAPFALKAITWADSSKVQLDDDVISIGNSPLWKETISGGKITGLVRPQSGQSTTIELLQMNFNLDRGDSGGPILDRQAHFLGIVVAKNTKKSRSSFAIPSNKIYNHFKNHVQ